VHQKSLDSVDLFEGRIREKAAPWFRCRTARRSGKVRLPCMTHSRSRAGSGRATNGDDGIEGSARPFIADPVLEQVADSTARRRSRFAFEEGDQALVARDILARWRSEAKSARTTSVTIVIDSMTTGECAHRREGAPDGRRLRILVTIHSGNDLADTA